jgi:hypothetical protein
VSIRYESSSDGEGLRSAVDCAALEGLLPRYMEAAAGTARAPDYGVDEEGAKRLLGLLDLKLDRVIAGLSSNPTRRRNKFRVLGLDSTLGRVSRPVADEDSGDFQVLGADPGLDLCLGLGLV